MTKISNVQPKQTPTTSKNNKNKGVVSGYVAGSFAKTPFVLGSTAALFGMRNISKISKQDSIDLSIATQEALKQSGLAEKGVKVFKVKETDIFAQIKGAFKNPDADPMEILQNLSMGYVKKDKKAMQAMVDELKGNKLLNKIVNSKVFKNNVGDSDDFLLTQAQKQLNQMKMGMNACFLPKANKVIIPSKHLQTSVFHELGHALNANGNILTKGLQKCRPLAKFAPIVILLVSLLNKRPKNSEKLENTTTENKIQNVKDGIKKHAGLLTGLSMAPMLLEEGLASLRGQKLAKSLVEQGTLSKDLFKKIKLTNLGGFASYAAAIVAAVAACEVAIKVKDKIQEKFDAEKLAKESVQNYHQGRA
ncbi:MAG: hypothetical protein IJB79_07125 [Candidatus Gastranaerophilales bacterium]|nr:hypothetical protein [Candidatus Gastranaerophilales bacterium]